MLEGGHPVVKDNRKAIESCSPVLDRHHPFGGNVPECEMKQFERSFVSRKRAAIFDDLPP